MQNILRPLKFAARSLQTQVHIKTTAQSQILNLYRNLNNKNLLLVPVCACYSLNIGLKLRHISTSNTLNNMSRSTKVKKIEPQSSFDYEKESKSISVGECEGWLTIGEYSIFAWSISGVESTVVVKSEDLILCFDMGVAIAESIRAKNIFITHGHIDHIGAVSSHVSKRSLLNMKPARYFVPPHLVEPLSAVVKAHYAMAETVEALGHVDIRPIGEGETAQFTSRFFSKSFPTQHRVKSQGYIIYKEEKKLKEEFHGMEGFEIAKLHREGTNIHDTIVTPEIAYTGDTTFSVFTEPPNPDLLKVKLLITEATYIDDEIGTDQAKRARDRGHIHLSEFYQNEDLFKDVGHILLVHFSAKYSPKYIMNVLHKQLPSSLIGKITPALVAKTTKPTTILPD